MGEAERAHREAARLTMSTVDRTQCSVKPRRFGASSAIVLALRFPVAGVFLLAGGSRALNAGGFALTLSQYSFIPNAFISPLAIFLPWLAVVPALCLLLWPAYPEAASAILLALVLGSSVVLAISLLTSHPSTYGGFGGYFAFLERPYIAIVYNIILFVLVLICFGASSPTPSTRADQGAR